MNQHYDVELSSILDRLCNPLIINASAIDKDVQIVKKLSIIIEKDRPQSGKLPNEIIETQGNCVPFDFNDRPAAGMISKIWKDIYVNAHVLLKKPQH